MGHGRKPVQERAPTGIGGRTCRVSCQGIRCWPHLCRRPARSQHFRPASQGARCISELSTGGCNGSEGGEIRIAAAKVLWSAATCRSFRFAGTSPPDVGGPTDVASPARAESKAVTCHRSPHDQFAPSRGLDRGRSCGNEATTTRRFAPRRVAGNRANEFGRARRGVRGLMRSEKIMVHSRSGVDVPFEIG
jgi:hypothetical protein